MIKLRQRLPRSVFRWVTNVMRWDFICYTSFLYINRHDSTTVRLARFFFLICRINIHSRVRLTCTYNSCSFLSIERRVGDVMYHNYHLFTGNKWLVNWLESSRPLQQAGESSVLVFLNWCSDALLSSLAEITGYFFFDHKQCWVKSRIH